MKAKIFILCALVASWATAQTTQKLTATKLNEYGLIYTLPTTTLCVTIETEKTVETPGEFYLYAKKYLGLDPITQSSVNHTLKSVTISPSASTNNDEQYLVQFKSGSTPFMMLSDRDFPLSINTDRTYSPAAVTLPQSVPAEPSILELPVATQAVTAEMLQSPSSAKRAELAAARIFELRQSRSEIISGSAENMPADGQAMQLALDNLNAQEQALTAMFIGTRQVSTSVETITVQPTKEQNALDGWEMVVARLSKHTGLVASTDLSGDPIYLNLTVTSRGQLPKNEKGEEKRFPKGGLAYCIPGQATVTASFLGKDVAQASVDMAQYGVVFGLDPGIFVDKKAPAYAIFNPLTGAIVEIGTVQ